jgi:hypothetical protein
MSLRTIQSHPIMPGVVIFLAYCGADLTLGKSGTVCPWVCLYAPSTTFNHFYFCDSKLLQMLDVCIVTIKFFWYSAELLYGVYGHLEICDR